MLQFLDVFENARAEGRPQGAIATAGRLVGLGFFALLFMLTIYTLW